jgi:hypothetical protein
MSAKPQTLSEVRALAEQSLGDPESSQHFLLALGVSPEAFTALDEQAQAKHLQQLQAGAQNQFQSYGFDLTLKAAIRVKAASPERGIQLLHSTLDAADGSAGVWPNGDPVRFEVSTAEGFEPELVSVDGQEYCFDVTLKAAIRVQAASPEQGIQLLHSAFDAADGTAGSWPDGEPVRFEASIAEGYEPELFDIDQDEIDQRSVGAINGRFAAGDWTHLFGVGGRETECRVVIDCEKQELVVASERVSAMHFQEIRGARFRDLAESVIAANEAHQDPEGHGLVRCDLMPTWAAAILVERDQVIGRVEGEQAKLEQGGNSSPSPGM